MRFDDRLATVLAQPLDDAAACAIAWRQIVDLVAQMPPQVAPAALLDPLAALRRLRGRVPQGVRAGAAAALAGRCVNPAVVALLAADRPAIAEVVIGGVDLDDGAWLALLPRLTIGLRAVLRRRDDVSPRVRAGLSCLGPTDPALPPPPPAPPPPGPEANGPDEQPPASSSRQGTVPASATDVAGRESLADVAAAACAADPAMLAPADGTMPFAAPAASLSHAPAFPPPLAFDEGPPDAASPATDFRFETGPDGVILWVEGVPRAALIGTAIMPPAARPGLAGQAAAVVRHHASFRDAPMFVAGGSATAGEWRIAGVPTFDPRDGRFTGYRGTARRPAGGRHAMPAADGLYGTGLSADSLRQLVHELRTPLNAIVGFGEMIERQMLGPAALGYRLQAGGIVEQGRRLLAVVDDLDMAARADGTPPQGAPAPVAPADVLHTLWRAHRAIAADRGVTLEMAIDAPIEAVDADPAAIERMYARLLASAIGLGRSGERIVARLGCAGGVVELRLTRPAVLGDSDEAKLLDPGFTPAGDWPAAPLLGLGFSLRLVRNLAVAAGGGLSIAADGFILHLPVAAGRRANGVAPR